MTDVVGRPSTTARSDPALLRAATTFFAVAVLLHNADHLRRGGDSVSAQVFWVGSAAILVEVGVVALVAGGQASAPLAAIAAGFGLALGYIVVHFTPERSWLSDSLLRDGASPLSIAAAALEAVAALALGVTGLLVLRRRGGMAAVTDPANRSFDVGAVLRDPVVLAMVVGNLVIFAGSLATR